MAVLTPDEAAAVSAAERVLEIGCGQRKRVPHSVALDINPDSEADTIHDLNVFPYPFADGEFDMVIAEHVLEHLDDLLGATEELHRIIKPGGLLLVEVPHFSSSNFYTDPTHRHAFSTRSFDYYIPGSVLSEYKYSRAAFQKRSVSIGFITGALMTPGMARWFNKHRNFYEMRLAFMFPAEHIDFVLEVVK